MSELSIKPGVSLGSYPQRLEQPLDDLEAAIQGKVERLRARLARKRRSQAYIVRKVNRHEETLKNCCDEKFNAVLQELRSQLHRRGLQESLIIEAFAVIREAAVRTQASFRRAALRWLVDD